MKKGRSKRVFDYVRRSVSGRKRDRDDEIGGLGSPEVPRRRARSTQRPSRSGRGDKAF
jgi:hypothetical protein